MLSDRAWTVLARLPFEAAELRDDRVIQAGCKRAHSRRPGGHRSKVTKLSTVLEKKGYIYLP